MPNKLCSVEIFDPTKLELTSPCHPALAIKTWLMQNIGLTREDMAERMGTTLARMDNILAESEPLTIEDARKLKVHFGKAAEALIQIQAMRDFFKEHGRRPTVDERGPLFASVAL